MSLREELEKYLMHWKWFALSVICCVFLAFVYLKLAQPKYEVSASLMIKQDDTSFSSELAAFNDLNLLNGNGYNVENEMQLLKSRTLLNSVVNDLELNVSYHKKRIFKYAEIEKNKVPVALKNIKGNFLYSKLDTTLYVNK